MTLTKQSDTYTAILNDIKSKKNALGNTVTDDAITTFYAEVGQLLDKYKLSTPDLEMLATDLHTDSDRIDLSKDNLKMMVAFHNAFAKSDVLRSLTTAIDWSKHIAIINAHDDTNAQEFYIRMTRKFQWTEAELQKKLEMFRPS